MTIKGKGKEVAGKGKAPVSRGDDEGKFGGGRKRMSRGVLQFFEDTADVDDSDESDYSDFGDDFVEEDIDMTQTMTNEPAKGQNLPFFPKEEMIDEEEFDKMMEERYGDGSRFVTYAGDEFDDKTIEPNSVPAAHSDSSPTIWKVKCAVGRERLSAFCLMQKFVDLKLLGTKINIVSAFAVDHMKGLIYIEAEKQCDINEACKGLSSIYVSRVQPVPKNEVSHLFNARSRCNEVSVGMWVRVKNGIYKGDLAQVAAVNNAHRRATVKLIPRIDLQALAAKFGGGYRLQKGAVPAPRLISSSELEEFRPLMQYRRDRDTGKVFEILDGLMLKDGYLYKKVAIDSLNLWGVEPTEEELLKFRLSESNEENDLEWLSQIYGEPKKRRIIGNDKVGGKGESSSGSGMGDSFELYDLVCFKRKEFGIIVGMEKDDSYKILKESAEGSIVVTMERRDVKSGSFDIRLSAQDQHKKTILVNDTVRVLEGPSKDRQGIIKHIYRGVVFIYDESEEENGGYFTCKSHMCEKIKLSVGDYSGKGSEPGPLVFEDTPSSPQSPLSPKRPWQARENREFNRGDNDAPFNIGQTLRIRVGPLKGYICRVIAIRRSDVTVKLDSQQKVFTVKCENLSEVGKRTTTSTSGDPDSSSFKPFDLLGTGGSSGGWMDGVGTSAGSNGWNTGGVSTERSAWPSHSNFLQPDSTANEGNDSGRGAEDTAWEVKSTSNQNSSWGAAVENNGTDVDCDQSGGWAKGGGSWGQAKPADENQNSGWNKKPNDADANPSGWESASNWNTAKTLQLGSAATEWGQGSSKSGSDDGGDGNSTWGSGKGTENNSGWKSKPNGRDGNQPFGWESKGNRATPKTEATEWGKGSSKNGSDDGGNKCSTWGSGKKGAEDDSEWGKGSLKNGSDDGGNKNSTWASGKKEDNSGWENKPDGDENKNSNWSTGCAGAEIQDSNWAKKSNWNSGSSANQDSGWNKSSNLSSGPADAEIQDSNWGKKSNWNSGNGGSAATEWGKGSLKGGSDEGGNVNPTWGSGKGAKDKSGWENKPNGDENHNSNWNTGRPSTEIQDCNRGKKSNWNSGNGGNQDSGWNKSSNSSSGPADAEIQDSDWGKKGNLNSGNGGNQGSSWKNGSDDGGNVKSTWCSGKGVEDSSGWKNNWNSGNGGNQNSSWNKGNNWSSGSGNTSQNTSWGRNNNWQQGNASNTDQSFGQNEDPNETSGDGGSSGNWRGGYGSRNDSDQGGFRGKGGYRGRGERGGYGGGRGERGGYGGRGDRGGSDRGFRGRARGRRDQPGGWNNKRDSGEDGSSDWNKGADNDIGGWKNSGSGSWSQKPSSWNKGGGSNW